MASVDASVKFKMADHRILFCKMATVCVRSRWCFGVQWKMARAFAKVQCGNSIIYITYLISAAPPCSMTLTRLMLISVKYCVIHRGGYALYGSSQ